ncbi:kinesin-related protein 4 [Leptopilina heterotoma]|uniref:kinesin-related protein 4 n=1 Tax=Leptopilina heterotoma TaxID=63436 RepID=UPI001CA9FC68|nr:kinesin-related protein 4 [Leptopilina heterotoma]
MSDNIKVAIKVRPLVEREVDEYQTLQWNVCGNTITPIDDSKRRGEGGFQFDHIFDMEAKNEVIFNTVVKPIINSAVDGFNGTVFAYGQTGSGKTHTMMGSINEPGIIPLAIQHMFDTIEKTMNREFLIRFSYFEIYNEKINDLLNIENTDLKIKDENGRIFVHNCSERVTNGTKKMLDGMKWGEKNRSIGVTNMNDRSSRSHTIFKITIESRETTSDSDGAIQISQLNLVDLAGSERASQTGSTGERFKEGTHINTSLLCLGNVIKQLSECQDKPTFINFRDSKLTRILQASLGGNSLTAIICTVTPASFGETYCTLSFASRAKSVKNKPKLNEDLSDEALLKRYRKQIMELSKELKKANQTIENTKNNTGLADRMELLKEYIVSGNKKTCVRRRSCPVKFGFENAFPSLQPIIEDPCHETPKQDKIKKFKRRQSIMQSANSVKETKAALADFEINLLKSDFEPEEELTMEIEPQDFVIPRRQTRPRVQFNDVDDVLIIDTNFISPDKSTEKRCNCSMSASPGTPKSVLRERYKALAVEHKELAENTTLERQLDKENYETLRNLKKSLDDTNILYSDVNKKYSDLQTEHSLLLEESSILRKQVESLSPLQERLGKIEIESKELHNKLNVALKAQKFAEDENVSIAYQLDSMSAKFKKREKELELSLQNAWKSTDKTEMEKTTTEILRLENLVKTLNEEIEQLKIQKPRINESDPIIIEMNNLKEKLEETNRLLKESDFEKTSLIERLDCLSQKIQMKTKIDEYENLLQNLEEDKIHTLNRFEELAKELEQHESGLEMTTLQKAVNNLSSHLTEYERENVHVRRKFSIFLAYIEFVCQEACDNKFPNDELVDISTNFENWRKSISYDDKEKSDIIFELKQFRESLIRRSKSSEFCEKETIMKIDKETSIDEEIVQNEKKIISELNEKFNEEKVKLNNELVELKEKLLKSDEKLNEYDNLLLKLKDNETKIDKLEDENSKMVSNSKENSCVYEKEISELKEKILELDSEKSVLNRNLSEALEKLTGNSEIVSNLQENVEIYEKEVSVLKEKILEIESEKSTLNSNLSEALEKLTVNSKIVSNFEENVDVHKKEISELKEKILELESQKSSVNTNLSEVMGKLTTYEETSNKMENERESKLKEIEMENSQLKSQISEVEKKITDLKTKIDESEREKGEKDQEIREKDLALKEKERELKEKEQEFQEKEQELIEKDVNLKEKQQLIDETEEKLQILMEKSKELEHLNSELKSKLSEATEAIKNYIETIESLKVQTTSDKNSLDSKIKELEENNNELKIHLESNNLEIKTLEFKIKELDEENTELKIQLESNNPIETSFCAIDTRLEEKDAEISQLTLRIKELGDENFELKSRIEDVEEKLKSYQNSLSSLNIDNERLTTELKEKEMDLSHLKIRYKELENMNNSFAKSNQQSMNNTNDETYNEAGEEFVRNYLAASDVIQKGLENFEKKTLVFPDEQKTFIEGLEKSHLTRSILHASNKMSTPTKMELSINCETPKSIGKSYNENNDSTSIFNNDSYFNKMEIDETIDDCQEIAQQPINETQDFTAPSMMINILKSNDLPTLKRRVKDLESQNENLNSLYNDLMKQITENNGEELTQKIDDFKNVKISLEIENSRLRDEVQGKIQEAEEIKSGIQGLKMDIEQLQQTIYLLNTENVELVGKLNAEKVKNQEIEYERMENLKTENKELIGKVKELEEIKDCIEYDHECIFKEKNKLLQEQNDSLQNEITDLSDDLMKHIDDCETIKNQLDDALKKLEFHEKTTDTTENIKKKHLQDELIEEVTSNISLICDQLDKSIENQKTRLNNSWKMELNEKIKQQEEEIQHLTIMNEKLSELKLTACTQCSHLKELNENKRALKLEVKCLNNKLEELQTRFQEKCISVEALRIKANEELNVSFNLNESVTEIMSVTLMEENIRHLSNEKEELKEEYEKLTVLYQDKCSDLETLQEQKINTISPSTSPGGKRERLKKVESSIKAFGDDLEEHRKKLANVNSELEKYRELEEKLKTTQEILIETQENLRISQEALKENSSTAEEKIKLLEKEISLLYKNIEEHKETEIMLQTEKLNLEVNLQISQSEAEKKLQTLENILEERNSNLREYEEMNKTLESRIKETEHKIEDNEKKIRELVSNLENMKEEKLNREKNESRETEINELYEAKKLIIKETMSMTAKIEVSSKTASELFENFLNTILSKEHEVIQAIKENFEQEKRKLIDEKQQSDDKEKRVSTWAKSLENDIERLQTDFTEIETKNHQLQKQLEIIEQENQTLREKFQVLQNDYNQLQNDYDTKFDVSLRESENIDEKIQSEVKIHEIEFKNRLKQQKEDYNKKLEELTLCIKNLETVNIDLSGNVEGLEANEKQLKNIVEMKTKDLGKQNQLVKELHSEVEKITIVNNLQLGEINEKNERIEQITLLLKEKCDTLSEYKTKLENLMPEYNHLKTQIEERREIVQKFREENENLKLQHMEELNNLRDQVQENEIKNLSFVKQFEELNKRNSETYQELEGMRQKHQEMEISYDKLMRKVRNSTNKHRAEQEIQDIMDKNRTLEKNLEGASNRIKELMDAKAKAMKDLLDLKNLNEIIKTENEELKTLHTRNNSLFELRGKYEELLQEKNTIKLELEEKKLILIQLEKNNQEISQELTKLRSTNEELDKEADELAKKIEENESEIGKLEDENFYLQERTKHEIDELKAKLKQQLQTNTDLRADIELKRTTIITAQNDNDELKCKINELENRIEAMSTASSRSTSPMLDFDKRRKRRSDLFNKNRHLDEFSSDSGVSSNCQCSDLRKSLSELGREIAMKNAVIDTLNIQIRSEIFPYEKKCQDLQEEMALLRNKCRKLQEEVYSLRKKIMDMSSKECEVCNKWRQNQRHQEVQCVIEEKIYLSGRSSGIVEDYQRQEKLERDNKLLEQKIKKIENEKDLMKKLCRSRNAKIKELELQIENPQKIT